MCSSDIPDTSAAQNAATALNSTIAEKNFGLQSEMLDYFKGRQTGVDADAKTASDRAFALAQTTTDQGTDLYNYQKDVFRPVEQSLVTQAMQESTPAAYEEFARKAVASTAGAQANAQGQMERNLASMGVNPNSGAYASAQRGLQLGNSAALAGVANDSRAQADALSWAHRADAAGIGKGLVGAGNASYGIATENNAQGTGVTNAANAQAGASLGTPTQYGGLAVTGANNASSAYQSIYGTQAAAASQASSSSTSALGSLAGAGLAAFMM